MGDKNQKAIDKALQKGTQYLLLHKDQDHWNGFPTLAGQSDVWVTGFVQKHLAMANENKVESEQVLRYLLHARLATGGWSYNPTVPCDADSTAWCLMALQQSSKTAYSNLAEDKTVLWNHYQENGVSTYRADSGISTFIGLKGDQSIAGWTDAHTDVSLAAILADPGDERCEKLIARIITQVPSSGFLESYWWRGPHYATTLLLRAIRQLNYRLPLAVAERILRALMREQLPDGGYGIGANYKMDPFTTSLALESFTRLSYLGEMDRLRLAGQSLLDAQDRGGGWKGDFILRIPAPNVANPAHVSDWIQGGKGGNSFVKDEQGLFATAVALYALYCWKNSETKKGKELPEFNPAVPSTPYDGSEIKMHRQ